MISGTNHIPHNYLWAVTVAINLMGSKVTRIEAVKLHLHGQLSYKEERGKAERCRAYHGLDIPSATSNSCWLVTRSNTTLYPTFN